MPHTGKGYLESPAQRLPRGAAAGSSFPAIADYAVLSDCENTCLVAPGGSALHRRTPGDFDADHVLIRIAACVHGSVEIALDCEPAFDYGRTDATWDYTETGYDEVVTTNTGPVSLRLAGDLRLGHDGRAVRARHRLQAGESCFAALTWGTRPLPADLGEAREALAHTERFWRGWLDAANFPDHPWREPLQRSALTLKALSYAPTGAFLAASTTSLPEHPGGERNWDYRYTWIRDSSFTLRALHGLGHRTCRSCTASTASGRPWR
jgi:GH15 family glucan-1,4-alpha-glucosidase